MAASSSQTPPPPSTDRITATNTIRNVSSKLTKRREVANGVLNLGNTCYINAVLQALAHAPELLQAMELEPHCSECPIYLRNHPTEDDSSDKVDDESSKKEGGNEGGGAMVAAMEAATQAVLSETPVTRPSRNKKSKKGPSRSVTPIPPPVPREEFCILAELESLLERVTTTTTTTSTNGTDAATLALDEKAVAPSTFVQGFVTHIAPWFRLGVQEDSHEFLRLLIDSLQRAAQKARRTVSSSGEEGTVTVTQKKEEDDDDEDKEYPFYLFRGSVESIVTCSSCGATTTKIDPMEDVGLDVTPSSSSHGLCDVLTSLDRFTSTERLDAHYKCDACHVKGTSTKQSRLGAIPPILTLHLKRFRYGGVAATAVGGRGSSYGGGVSTSTRRRGGEAMDGGTSGSAKLEGHVKFEQVLNMKPYMTPSLQSQTKSMFGRLFAVIVHQGKNSHSGHYLAYVRNWKRNEWWKMDDAKVQCVDTKEVMMAEAYMLFYRVVDHPIALDLRKREEEMIRHKKE